MLAVVHLEGRVFPFTGMVVEGEGPSAEEGPLLHQGYTEAAFQEMAGCRYAGQASSQDDDVGLEAVGEAHREGSKLFTQVRRVTQPFSPRPSFTLSWKTS